MKLSVVIPLFNEEETIKECILRVSTVLEKVDGGYELIFVNDGSNDKTEEIVKENIKVNNNIKLISFSRNFGHQVAITAGMDYTKGEAVVVMDGDLQDPPELILDMLAKFHEGYDVIYAKRAKRKGESIFKIATAKIYYRFLRAMCNIDIPIDTGDFRLISRKVCDTLKTLPERNRYVRGLVSWVGFKQVAIEYKRDARYAGKTKYPLSKMIKLSMDGMTSFSQKPLALSRNLGVLLAISGFIYAIYVLLRKIIEEVPNDGWSSTIILLLVIGGVQLIMLGIVGEYIGRIFDESKGRPLYIVDETYNMEK